MTRVIQAPGGVILDDGLWYVSHHVISDLYRKARHLLRKAGVLRNPSAEARAAVARRARQTWQDPT